jgi:tyrosyl-tRNA synthetase
MPGLPPLNEQMDAIRRGAVEIIPEDHLAKKIERSIRMGTPLIVKQGFDPTRPHLHLGYMVSIRKLRTFQELGHKVVFLLGDFTALVGDPSGRSETRPRLTEEEVQVNAATYREQVFKVLDPAATVIERNSSWLGALSTIEVLTLASHYTVARMLERDDFAKRYEEERAIGVHEFLYPLIQGYDSVALHADVEVGGTDQRFNLLVGREIQKAYGQASQVVVTLPLLEGTDGVQKMSKSLGNAIGIADRPDEMFGKLMSISDAMMLRYYELLVGEDVNALRGQIESGAVHPMEAKKRLARTIVARFSGEATGRQEQERFERQFQRRQVPEDVPTFEWRGTPPATVRLAEVLTASGMTGSLSEARRLVQQGAVRVDGQRVADAHCTIAPTEKELLIQVGPRRIQSIIFFPKKGG